MGEPAVKLATVAPTRGMFADVDRIEVRDRLRALDPDWAAALAVSIQGEGLIHPVELRALPGGRLRLVIGLHRLAAHRQLGLKQIEYVLFDGDAATARRREVAENLIRRELSPLDRAAFIAELYEGEKARFGWEEGQSSQSFIAQRRWAKDAGAKIALASGLADEVASKVGLSARSVTYDLSLFRDLAPAVRAMLATHPVAENASQLRLLARSGEQLRIAQLLVDGKAADVGKALDLINPRVASVTPQDVFAGRLISLWAKLAGKTKRRLLAHIAADPSLPADLKALLKPLRSKGADHGA